MSKRILARLQPRRSAILFKNQERPNLIVQQNEWLDWDGHSYVSIEESTIDSEIAAWLDASYEQAINKNTGQKITKAFNPTPRDVFNVRDSLKKKVHKAVDTFKAPCWLDGKDERRPKPSQLISVQNGLLDITTRRLYKASPLFFNRATLPIEYNADAPEPKLWKKFLGEALKDRTSLIELLQELFGYTISDDTCQHIVPHLWGVPRGGKGTTLRVLTDLVGAENVASPSIMELGTTFGLEGCIAKSLITITDMNTDNKSQCAEAGVWINKISGEDFVQIMRKNIGVWRGRLPGRMWIASNNLPDFGSHAEAVATRLAVIPFEVSFLGREDRTLTNKEGTGKLQLELPSILNWALDGLDRLRDRGRFNEPLESVNAKLKMLYSSEPVRGFVAGRCVLDPTTSTDKDVLYARYEAYCVAAGVHPLAFSKFADRLHTIYPAVVPSKRSAGDGTRPPTFAGIRLNDLELPEAFMIDPEIEGLGITGPDALMLDDRGWPIEKAVAEDFAE